MREITVRQYSINVAQPFSEFLDAELNLMLKEGWELRTTNIITDSHYPGGEDWTRIMDAQVRSLQTKHTHYLVCTFERSAAAQALFKAKGNE